MKRCTGCDRENEDDVKFCTGCGSALGSLQSSPNQTSDANNTQNMKVSIALNDALKWIVLAAIVIILAVIGFIAVKSGREWHTRAQISGSLPDDTERRMGTVVTEEVMIEAATRVGAVTEEVIEAVVNVAGTNGERFIKAGIVFEYDDKNKILSRELERRTPVLRDRFIRYLSGLSLTEITEHGAQDRIEKDLLRDLNSTLPEGSGEIQSVRFVSFVIQ